MEIYLTLIVSHLLTWLRVFFGHERKEKKSTAKKEKSKIKKFIWQCESFHKIFGCNLKQSLVE